MKEIFEEARLASLQNLKLIRTKMNKVYSHKNPEYKQICVYACGSLGRLEMTQKTDLDLFFIVMSKNKQIIEKVNSNTSKYLFFSQLYEINSELKFHKPSKLGRYWDFIPKDNLLDIGSQEEDYNNSFTARMLLILESKPLYNENAYNHLIQEVVDKYFVDYKDHSDGFYPLFLMNDILRYWYTLTLNYEYRRDGKDDKNTKSWKRLKLKYARLMTCFSMIACLYKENVSPDYVLDCIKKTPFERLHMLSASNADLTKIVELIEDQYKWFLLLRTEGQLWWNNEENVKLANQKADEFHELMVCRFIGEVSKSNPSLRAKADIY